MPGGQPMSDANYADDASEVPCVRVFESEEADATEEFAEYLYDNKQPPRNPAPGKDIRSMDQDDPDNWVVDEERAQAEASEYYRHARARDGSRVVLKLPGWFAQDELGEWQSWWFGTFQTAKNDPEDGWTAMCLSDIEPMCDRHEDEYFRAPRDEEWLPLSLIEAAYIVQRPPSDVAVVDDEGVETGTEDEPDILLTHIEQTRYGHKVHLESPFGAKDDIKALDWDAHHPDWTGDNWTVDKDGIYAVIEHLVDAGWSVGVSRRVSRECASSEMEPSYLPREIVESSGVSL